jgi:RNA polymerase sigma factor (sigma-70 family)
VCRACSRRHDGEGQRDDRSPEAWNLRGARGLFLIVDPGLVQAAQEGDALAIDQLLDELLPMVRRLSAAVAPSVAEDATQEALISIFRNLHGLKSPEAIVTWTRKLTVRVALRLARGARRDQPLEAGPAPSLESGEQLVDLMDALARLPLEQRTVVALRAIEGLSELEVARTLDVPVGTVKSRLHRARTRLREGWLS